ncbi:MAG: hypothetical protein OXQ86_00340 [Gammaproteobacteria bacterium]|nr:hypothetical protein [Gammaproteobacteria bacterium]MDE0415065.1 hypothetical protein [Gammaproteobacteria bacterium]
MLADLAIFDRSGQIAAVAEIKRRLGTSCDWAAQVRRNLLAHDIRRVAGYFLLITPDRLYLWKDSGTNPDKVPPTHEADMQPEFAKYFAGAEIDPSHVSEGAFELLVGAWLGELTRLEDEAKDLAENRSWLAESGLLSAVKDGRIEYEVPV